MAENTFEKFENLCNVLSNLTPLQVAVVAKQQGIAIPPEITQQITAAELIQEWKEGSEKDPDRVYLKTKGFVISPPGAESKSTAKGLYLEVRALRQARDLLDAAIKMAEDRGYNTAPSVSARQSGPVKSS